MKLVVSGGGTGGHLYPGLTVARNLLDSEPGDHSHPAMGLEEVLWIGSRGGMEEEIVRQQGLNLVTLAAGGLRGARFWAALRNLRQMGASVGAARRILDRFRPDVVLATGGYACVSVTMAAWTLRVPVLIYLPDIVPGLAIRFLSRFATRIAVTSKDSFQYLPRSKCVVTGYPVRPELLALDRSEARRRLGLDPNGPVLLVLGGSRGAKSINRALVAGLPELLSICQVVHISGKLDADWVRDATAHLPEALQGRYHLYPYLHEIPAAMVAADLAVARAGAATMGEFPAAALPAVLVPYPYSGQHQQPNAAYLSRNGAALVLDDGEISTQLLPAVQGLLRDREKRERMRMASRALSCPGAAEAIAEHLRALARQHSHGAAG